MKNKEKIIIALISLSFFLILYFLIVSKQIELPEEKVVINKNKTEKVDLALLKETYQEKVRNIYKRLEEDINKGGVEMGGELEPIRAQLISMVVPEEYRVFHISFIMLLDKVINNEFSLEDNFELELNKIVQKNEWLK